MSPSIDRKWCQVRAVTLLAFNKSIETLVAFVVFGHHVANMIIVCFPTLFIICFLNFYVSVPVFLLSRASCFLVCSFLPSRYLANDSSDHGWLNLVDVIFDGTCFLMIWRHDGLKLVHKLSTGVEVLFSARNLSSTLLLLCL